MIRKLIEYLKNIFCKKENKKLLQVSSEKVKFNNNEYEIKGKKDDFKIKFKEKEIEFIVKNGIIVGVKDLKKNQIFYYINEVE